MLIFRTAKIGCRSKIYFCCKGDKLQVGRYEVKHNHEVNPLNGCGKLKVPVGKTRRKRPLQLDYKPVSKTARAGQYDDDYDTAPETSNFCRSPKPDIKDANWIDACGVDFYPSVAEVCDISSRRVSRTSPAVLLSQLEFSLENLKSLATSGGTDRLFSCLQYLNALENKWRQEFGEAPSYNGIEETVAATDTSPNDVISDTSPRRRLGILHQTGRPLSREIFSMDVAQPQDAEPPEVEYINRTWF